MSSKSNPSGDSPTRSSRPVSGFVEEVPLQGEDDIEEVELDSHIDIDDPAPPVSPRDKLSYVEDKKAWKEFNKFHDEHPQLELLLMRMQTAIFKAKPDNIVKFLATDFFADHKAVKLREELDRLMDGKR